MFNIFCLILYLTSCYIRLSDDILMPDADVCKIVLEDSNDQLAIYGIRD